MVVAEFSAISNVFFGWSFQLWQKNRKRFCTYRESLRRKVEVLSKSNSVNASAHCKARHRIITASIVTYWKLLVLPSKGQICAAKRTFATWSSMRKGSLWAALVVNDEIVFIDIVSKAALERTTDTVIALFEFASQKWCCNFQCQFLKFSDDFINHRYDAKLTEDLILTDFLQCFS